jgi:glucosylceramidase
MLRAAISILLPLALIDLMGCSGGNNRAGSSPIQPIAATPVIGPAPGTYSSAQSITLSDATAGASIHYTTDGSNPTAASNLYSTPLVISATTTINAFAVAPGYSSSNVAPGTFVLLATGPAVSVVLSTDSHSELMTSQPSINFISNTFDAGTNTITVDSSQQYQSIDGFGAAFTDSAAYLLNEVADKSQLSSALSNLFTRTGMGIGLSFMRSPMGDSDIARSVYSFDDHPTGETDPTLADFSIAHDQVDIIPIILQAKSLNPQMKIVATPWSPPGWMKDPASMNPVSMLGGTLLMTGTNETAFANYFVKYIHAYESAGIHIDYITLQNEPLNITSSYPSMGMTDNTQLTLLQNYVLPALASNNISTQVMAYDHNWDTASYPESVLSGLTAQQLGQVAGTDWHGYAGTPGAQQTLANLYPSQGQWMTEHSGGTWINDQFTSDFLDMTQVLRNAGRAYVKWSLALDQNLGPNLTQNAGLGGCNTCTPIVTVNSSTGAITYDVEYYTLGHYSKYVLPGAVRIYSSNTPVIATAAFQNPDGSTAMIAYNNSGLSQSFVAQWGGTLSFGYTLPPLSAATFTWAGPQSGTPTIAAASQIQGSSYSSENGLQTEVTGDSTGEYDLGYVTPGAYAIYKHLDFGAGVSQVEVRTASAGNGGEVAFYLDAMTGPPIATCTLPVTGGWQAWETVSAPVTAALGVHDLYLVFSGGGSTGSIANLNWFAFQ